MKQSDAKDRHFCSRSCMFAAWGCAICSKLRPEDRRLAGDKYCSDRCSLTAHLEALAEETGQALAFCGKCKRIQPAEEFTKERKNRNGLSNKCKDCTRGYYSANKDLYRARRYGYQAKPGGIVVEFTPTQKAARFALWNGRCWMCGIAGATEEDHVKPISKGGSHCLANLRPICKHCNTSKGGRWPLADMRANFIHPAPRSGNAGDNIKPRQPRVMWTCPQCQETTAIRAHLARTQKHCSRACSVAARRATILTKICLNPVCAKSFNLPDQKGTRTRKFCSIECAWIARDRPAHWGQPSANQMALF